MNTTSLIAARLLSTDMGFETPCLIWQGTIAKSGHGVVGIDGRQHKVHRLTFEHRNGPLTPGLVIKHACGIRSCANPDHLKAVTKGEAVLLGGSFSAVNAAKTQCDRGHEYTPESTTTTAQGHRTCKLCRRAGERMRDAAKRKARREALGLPPLPPKTTKVAQRRAPRPRSVLILGMPARFWAMTKIEDAGYVTPCLSWTGSTSRGYGRYGHNGKTGNAYRIAYEVMVGPVPPELVLDHLCRNRSCVNVTHLEPVTNAENVLRGDTFAAANRNKTHCVHGHEFTPENTVIAAGGARQCLTCRHARNEAHNEQRRNERTRLTTMNPRAKPTHCQAGHAITPENSRYTKQGWRVCKPCARAANLRYKESHRSV